MHINNDNSVPTASISGSVPGDHVLVQGPGGIEVFCADERQAKEVLEALNAAYAYAHDKAQQKQEPVAWMTKEGRVDSLGVGLRGLRNERNGPEYFGKHWCIPLYIRPESAIKPGTKVLTDDIANHLAKHFDELRKENNGFTHRQILEAAIVYARDHEYLGHEEVKLSAIMEAVAEGMNNAEDAGEDPMSWIQSCVAKVTGVTPLTEEERLPTIKLKPATSDIRPAVLWFAQQMEASLQRNDHKDGWTGDHGLLNRLRDEVEELNDAIFDCGPFDHIILEATDVANFAMMIADNYGPNIGNKK